MKAMMGRTWMKTKEGGATPKKDPVQNGTNGTPVQIQYVT